MTEENHEKTPVRLVGTGIRTRDLPNASLVRYHGATSLGFQLGETLQLVTVCKQTIRTKEYILMQLLYPNRYYNIGEFA